MQIGFLLVYVSPLVAVPKSTQMCKFFQEQPTKSNTFVCKTVLRAKSQNKLFAMRCTKNGKEERNEM